MRQKPLTFFLQFLTDLAINLTDQVKNLLERILPHGKGYLLIQTTQNAEKDQET
jgi:hypothetical protein